MLINGSKNGVGSAIFHRHDATSVRQLIKHRVYATDVIVKQKGDGALAMTQHLELLKNSQEIMNSGLAFASRAGRKKDKTGMSHLAQVAIQVMPGFTG
ncbi:hypothetical protein D3C86_1297120 [compost metagenome]